MHTINILTRLVESHQVLAYGLIYLGLIFEGEFFLISTGILIYLGALNLWIALPIIFLGALSKAVFGYALGELIHKKFNQHKLFIYLQKRVYTLLPRFKEKPFWSIFISKFIFGANGTVIVFSGYEKINYRNFLKAEISAIIVWVPILLSLGSFFSYTALRVSHNIWRFLVVVLVLFIMFVLFDKLVSWLYEIFEEFYDRK